MVIASSPEDTSQLRRKLNFKADTICLHDNDDNLDVLVDSTIPADQHVEREARNTTQKVTLLHFMMHFLNGDGPLTLHKVTSEIVIENGYLGVKCPLSPKPARYGTEAE